MSVRVREVMRAEVVTVRPEMRLVELEEVLLRHRIQGAPVVSGGEVVGIVSRSDLVKHLQVEQSQAELMSAYYLEPFDADSASEADRERVAQTVGARWKDARVTDVMSRELLAIEPDAPLESAAKRMVERRVHRLLVMEGPRLVGLLSSLDFLRLVAEGRVELR